LSYEGGIVLLTRLKHESDALFLPESNRGS